MAVLARNVMISNCNEAGTNKGLKGARIVICWLSGVEPGLTIEDEVKVTPKCQWASGPAGESLPWFGMPETTVLPYPHLSPKTI